MEKTGRAGCWRNRKERQTSNWRWISFLWSHFRFGEQLGNQWLVTVGPNGYLIENPSLKEGIAQYYAVESGSYKNPIIEIEPDLAFPVPAELSYVDSKGDSVNPKFKIGGIIISEATPEDLGGLKSRTSLTPLYEGKDDEKQPKLKLIPTSYGIIYGGKEWYLEILIEKDKNRFINYDAIYGSEKPDEVRVVELADAKF